LENEGLYGEAGEIETGKKKSGLTLVEVLMSILLVGARNRVCLEWD
jgi:hypothetical protein